MLQFEGVRDLPLPPADLWAKLTDTRFLVGCIPDVESVPEAAPDHVTVVVRPGLSFVRGTLDATIQVVEKVEPSSATLRVISRGIGSNSTVDVGMFFSPRDGGTRVGWAVEVKELGGLLKMVPQGLIRGAAAKVIDDVWTSVARKLDSP
jgi:carbon monoxide dehydrogenase subunit G